MFERGSVGAPMPPESAGTTGTWRDRSLLHLSFVISASNTAQRRIRVSSEKTRFVFLAISLSIFGIQGDRILLILADQVRAGGLRLLFNLFFLMFLATMVVSLLYGLKTIAPRLELLAAKAGHRRLSWCSGTRWMST